LRCPYCGGNPVIYDPELNALVCTHCGTVIDDRPIQYTAPVKDEAFYGTVIKSRKHKALMYRHFDSVYEPEGRLARRVSRVAKSQCRVLGVRGSICVEAKKRALNAAGRVAREEDMQYFRTETLQYISAVSMYAVLSEHGYPVGLKDLCSRLSLDEVKAYKTLLRYGNIVGYRYTSKVKAYAHRVAQALFKQLRREDAERAVKRMLELMDKYSHLATDPLRSAAAFAVIAARELGFSVSVRGLCLDLGLPGSEASLIYARVQRLLRKMRGLKKK
jgi:transcription initiation factor TFIIIB Brf1 subunit/transcription initiation factor TFIIB